jgi:Flp pilus assembly pilin Flp
MSRPQVPSRAPALRGLLEYALILALAVITLAVAIILLGHPIQNVFRSVVTTLQGP